MRLAVTLLTASALLFSTGMAVGQEKPARPEGAAETNYQPTPETGELPKLLQATEETTYNAYGTTSTSTVALISNRRKDEEFKGFLQGMQQAALQQLSAPLHVAPLEAESLADQYNSLKARGITTVLIDSPNPADAKEFADQAVLLDLKVALITDSVRNAPAIPVIALSPGNEAIRAGEEAIRRVGNVPVTVAYATRYSDEELADVNNEAGQLFALFKRPFSISAPKVNLERLTPAHQHGQLQAPAVIVCFRPDDSAYFMPLITKAFPNSKIVLTGEDPSLVTALEEGQYDVRIRPAYGAILGTALREAAAPGRLPQILQPTADFGPNS